MEEAESTEVHLSWNGFHSDEKIIYFQVSWHNLLRQKQKQESQTNKKYTNNKAKTKKKHVAGMIKLAQNQCHISNFKLMTRHIQLIEN